MPVSGAIDYKETPLHAHPSYLFVLTFNNEISFGVAKSNLIAQPGSLAAILPSQLHRENFREHPLRYIAIFVDKVFLEDQFEDYGINSGTIFEGKDIAVSQDFVAYIREFIVEVGNRLPGWESVTRSISIRLCHSIVRSVLGLKGNGDYTKTPVSVDAVIEYMQEHLGEKLTLEKLAAYAKMSPSHFSRVFKKETGTSVMRYLNMIRLERIKHMLLQESYSIAELAYECGYSSPSHLATAFLKEYGQTPSEYRTLFTKSP